MLTLACVSPHEALPALTPGDLIGLTRTHLRTPTTDTVLARLIAAFMAGALVIVGPPGPTWDEIEREILATRDELLARADALLSLSEVRLRAG